MHHSCSILLYFKCVRRRRSYDRHPDLNLQQVLEDRRMADHMDSIPSYHTPKERQLAAVTELQNHQSALSTILVRSCWRSSSTDSSHTQKRSLQNSKLVSEPEGAPTKQIFNLRILCEKYLQYQQNLYHVFTDFKKAFDRIWHEALWATMRKYSISVNIIRVIEHLYDKAQECSPVQWQHIRLVQNYSWSPTRVSTLTNPL